MKKLYNYIWLERTLWALLIQFILFWTPFIYFFVLSGVAMFIFGFASLMNDGKEIYLMEAS